MIFTCHKIIGDVCSFESHRKGSDGDCSPALIGFLPTWVWMNSDFSTGWKYQTSENENKIWCYAMNIVWRTLVNLTDLESGAGTFSFMLPDIKRLVTLSRCYFFENINCLYTCVGPSTPGSSGLYLNPRKLHLIWPNHHLIIIKCDIEIWHKFATLF